MQKVINLDIYPYSNRHGTYGGMAGDKDGVLIDKEYWIVKYPKSTKTFKNNESLDIYTTSPLSEYIGSQIYNILGFDVHETMLGVRNNKVVVACKDFCESRGQLAEIRTIKNGAYKELSEIPETQLHSSATGDFVDLEELLLHIKLNPILKDTPKVIERFWEQSVIDVFIENNDRNNGNWGLLFDENSNSYHLAPVYDNGNSFMNKASESQISDFLKNPEDLKLSSIGARTSFEYKEHILSAKKFLKLQNEDFDNALIRIVPIIAKKMSEIKDFIQDIPESYQEHIVCSKNRKLCYIACLDNRMEYLLLPAYQQALQRKQEQSLNQNPPAPSMG